MTALLVEILPLDYTPGAANDTRSPAAAVAREIKQRNERNLGRWYAGRVERLADEIGAARQGGAL